MDSNVLLSNQPIPQELKDAYIHAVSQGGPDCQQVKDLRAANSQNRAFLEMADGLDRMKRIVGGRGMSKAVIPSKVNDSKGEQPRSRSAEASPVLVSASPVKPVSSVREAAAC